MIEQLLSKRQILERLSVCKSTLDTWRRYRDFPTPLKVAGLNRWRSSEIEQWVAKGQLKMNTGLSRPDLADAGHAKPLVDR